MARGTRIAEVVPRDEHVPLGAAVPRQRRLRLVHEAPVEDLQVSGAQDGHVVETQGFYGERHVRVGRRLVVAWRVGGGNLVGRGLRPVGDGYWRRLGAWRLSRRGRRWRLGARWLSWR